MTRKKNKFLTFCCSLLPGAGEMYLGFMKQGVSLMGLFFLVWAVSGILNLAALLFVEPVIWFYSFFHVHNLSSLPDEEFYAIEDDFLFHRSSFPFLDREWLDRNRKAAAAVLILLGVILLWNYLMDFLYMVLGMFSFSRRLYAAFRMFGTFSLRALFSIFIIMLGIHLIRSKKQELHDEDSSSAPLLPGDGDDIKNDAKNC